MAPVAHVEPIQPEVVPEPPPSKQVTTRSKGKAEATPVIFEVPKSEPVVANVEAEPTTVTTTTTATTATTAAAAAPSTTPLPHQPPVATAVIASPRCDGNT